MSRKIQHYSNVISSIIFINSDLKHIKHSWWLFLGHQEPGSDASVNKWSLRKKQQQPPPPHGRKEERLWGQRRAAETWRVSNAAKAVMVTLLVHNISPYASCLPCPHKTLFWKRFHCLIVKVSNKVSVLFIPLSISNKQTSLLKQNCVTLLT